MYTFEYLFTKYKTKYIYNHGQAKFNAVEQKVYGSDKLKDLDKKSSQQRVAPTAKDFGVILQSIGYFMFASSDTSAMAQMIAIKRWNETTNSKYGLCTEHELYFKGESALKQWSKYYNL